MNKILLLCMAVLTGLSCTSQVSKNPGNWSKKETAHWFQSGEWKCGWNVRPDHSVNQKEFAVQFFKNRDRWEKAFKFLASNDLKTLSLGKHELDGDNLFVNVSEYTTKNEEGAKYEAHRKYADLQYLVTGEEKIGIAPLSSTTVVTPYDSAKDFVSLQVSKPIYFDATSERFFIFFPEDAHCPGIKKGDNMNVRKVVVKIRID